LGVRVSHFTTPRIVDLDMERLDAALRRAETALSDEDYATLKAVVDSYAYLAELVGDKNTSIRRLRKLLFGARTEKTSAVVCGKKDEAASQTSSQGAVPPAEPPPQAGGPSGAEAQPEEGPQEDAPTPDETKGHGRNGAEAYTGAERIDVPHPSLQAGDPCPECEDGTVYAMNRPGVLVRLVGQAPLNAVVYHLEKLRCNLCGTIFTADPPAGVGEAKYDATVGSMIAVLKYGTGVPFHRAEKLQANLGIPLPSSTQWEEANAVPARARGTPGQQPLRTGVEKGDNAPQECPILQNLPRRSGGRHLHEPYSHL
jgi:transposase